MKEVSLMFCCLIILPFCSKSMAFSPHSQSILADDANLSHVSSVINSDSSWQEAFILPPPAPLASDASKTTLNQQRKEIRNESSTREHEAAMDSGLPDKRPGHRSKNKSPLQLQVDALKSATQENCDTLREFVPGPDNVNISFDFNCIQDERMQHERERKKQDLQLSKITIKKDTIKRFHEQIGPQYRKYSNMLESMESYCENYKFTFNPEYDLQDFKTELKELQDCYTIILNKFEEICNKEIVFIPEISWWLKEFSLFAVLCFNRIDLELIKHKEIAYAPCIVSSYICNNPQFSNYMKNHTNLTKKLENIYKLVDTLIFFLDNITSTSDFINILIYHPTSSMIHPIMIKDAEKHHNYINSTFSTNLNNHSLRFILHIFKSVDAFLIRYDYYFPQFRKISPSIEALLNKVTLKKTEWKANFKLPQPTV